MGPSEWAQAPPLFSTTLQGQLAMWPPKVPHLLAVGEQVQRLPLAVLPQRRNLCISVLIWFSEPDAWVARKCRRWEKDALTHPC